MQCIILRTRVPFFLRRKSIFIHHDRRVCYNIYTGTEKILLFLTRNCVGDILKDRFAYSRFLRGAIADHREIAWCGSPVPPRGLQHNETTVQKDDEERIEGGGTSQDGRCEKGSARNERGKVVRAKRRGGEKKKGCGGKDGDDEITCKKDNASRLGERKH